MYFWPLSLLGNIALCFFLLVGIDKTQNEYQIAYEQLTTKSIWAHTGFEKSNARGHGLFVLRQAKHLFTPLWKFNCQ